MSLLRASRQLRLHTSCGRATLPVVRSASTHADDHHHHESSHEDAVAFPKEDFSNSFWRRFVLAGLLAAGFYKFAPSPEEDNLVSRFVAQFKTPQDVWASINSKHLELSAKAQVNTSIVADAKRPLVHRYRFPQSFEAVSPHLQPVGMGVDLSDLVVKGEKDFPELK
ncbi:hypothetical protein K474DRAFT_1671433 [Panus rudis PR-1116 ss-1]|nr:hypothetical protein K474DRAFT_1671433 [Panus rudis PR-1116 ss-1]